MGNVFTNQNDPLLQTIRQYTAGDIDEFIRIVKQCSTIHDYRIKAWKIGCLYYYLMTLPESSHDIGYTTPKLIAEYKSLEASADPTIQEMLSIAMGTRRPVNEIIIDI